MMGFGERELAISSVLIVVPALLFASISGFLPPTWGSLRNGALSVSTAAVMDAGHRWGSTLPPVVFVSSFLSSPPTECVGWRQTGGCSSYGTREAHNDAPCTQSIISGRSGYCQCDSKANVVASRVDCVHSEFTCALACGAANKARAAAEAAAKKAAAERAERLAAKKAAAEKAAADRQAKEKAQADAMAAAAVKKGKDAADMAAAKKAADRAQTDAMAGAAAAKKAAASSAVELSYLACIFVCVIVIAVIWHKFKWLQDKVRALHRTIESLKSSRRILEGAVALEKVSSKQERCLRKLEHARKERKKVDDAVQRRKAKLGLIDWLGNTPGQRDLQQHMRTRSAYDTEIKALEAEIGGYERQIKAMIGETYSAGFSKGRKEEKARVQNQWGAYSDRVQTENAVHAFFARRQSDSRGGQQLRVSNVVKVENAQTLSKFHSSGNFYINPTEAFQKGGDTLLFHGLPQEAATNVQATGLLLSFAANGMLGSGLYGAPDPRKSLQYCRSANKFMFICRYNLASPARHAGPGTQHRNSIFDEFCVYNEQRVVVLWMLKLE